jgi:hypothetical protein
MLKIGGSFLARLSLCLAFGIGVHALGNAPPVTR